MTKKKIELRSQPRNATKHHPRGAAMLEDGVQQDGWIGAMTAAKNGDIFDGSLRHEHAVPVLDEEPIYVHSDGRRPVVVIRDDIPTAEDPRAKRLSVLANRVSNFNEWDSEVLDEWKGDIDLSKFWREYELINKQSDMIDDDDDELFTPITPKEIKCECPSCGYQFVRQTNKTSQYK